MNFDFSDEQKLLQETARKFLGSECTTAVARGILDSSVASYARPLWDRISELGWLGVTIPERFGGLELGPVALCAVAEELGRALAPVPFSSTLYLFTEALLLAGSDAQKAALLPDVAIGKVIGCLAVSEGPGPTDVSRLTVTVEGGRLSGSKLPVIDGAAATHAVVLAAEDGAPSLYLASLADPTVTAQRLEALDPTRGIALLNFAATPVERLGAPGEGEALLRSIENRAAVYFAFEQLGGAERALELARDYALERYAFGRPIGSYQAIKHKLADMYVRNQIARSNAYLGAWALESGVRLGSAAAAARIAASEAFWYVAKEAIQVFGGIGATWDADGHLYYRRAKQLALAIGAPALWKERLVVALEHELAG